MSGKDIFVNKKVTNQEIYEKLIDIEDRVVFTNGKVKFHSLHIHGLWASITAGGAMILWIITKV